MGTKLSGNFQDKIHSQKVILSYFKRRGAFFNFCDAACNIIENAFSENMPSVEIFVNGQISVVNLKYPLSKRANRCLNRERSKKKRWVKSANISKGSS